MCFKVFYMSIADMPQHATSGQFFKSIWRRASAPDAVLGAGTLIYLVIGSLFLIHTGQNPLVVLTAVTQAFSFAANLAGHVLPVWLLVSGVTIIAFLRPVRRHLTSRWVPSMAAVVYCSVFTCMFSSVKVNMPEVMPFWADDVLTRLDVALHFGHTPHDLLGALSGLDTTGLATFYLNSWILPATFFPVLLVACDPDPQRRRQFILLWMAAWVLIGNVAAVAFLSYGPIFADLFPGGLEEAHAGALALVEREDAGRLLAVKTRLWAAYSGEAGVVGSGISAFPSVHISMATVFGLYIHRLGRDLSRRLSSAPVARSLPILSAVLGAFCVLIYGVLSVYLGWHYAVDGYASVLIMVGLYRVMVSARVPVADKWSASGRVAVAAPMR